MNLLLSLILLSILPTVQAEQLYLCDVKNGLNLINREYYSVQQIEAILQSCDKVSPADPDVLFLHALLAKKLKQPEEAISWLKKARAAAPTNRVIILELGTTYEQTNQKNEAEKLYEYLLTKNPQDHLALLGKARIARLDSQYAQAEAIYQQLLAQNPQDVDALNGLGWIQSAHNQLTKAIYYFTETLKIQPKNTEALAALNQIKQTESQMAAQPLLCDTNKGLQLLTKPSPPLAEVNEILERCMHHSIENKETMLLRGLLARKKKNFKTAINWLQKALKISTSPNQNIEIELAVTYEWANQPAEALAIYMQLLAKNPDNRIALLGKGRVLVTLKKFNEAQTIYQQLLTKNAKDTDALNGQGWLALAQKNIKKATTIFQKSLAIKVDNAEATLGLQATKQAKIPPPVFLQLSPPLCDAPQGLILINQKQPPLAAIEKILIKCDKNTPNDTSTLVLHGLLARYLGQQNKNYTQAIFWFKKAVMSAEPGNTVPYFELAVTYEWAGDYKQALDLYQLILNQSPKNKSALLGKARVLRFDYQIQPALTIYHQLLSESPGDIEVLNGLGETYLTNYDFAHARSNFNQVLSIDPQNSRTKDDLKILNEATRNILDLTAGDYSVPPNTSNGFNLNYFRNLNATDGLTIFASHNTKQIESGFGLGPTLLPNNSLLIGYQHLIPNRYGWQLSYDARQHNGLPFEHRFYGAGNLFLHRNLEWFGGVRAIVPSIWNTLLLSSGATLYTQLPVNITVTGFWAFQQVEGYNSSYALDFSKEYSSRLFYDLGLAYLPQQQSLEYHGRLILPVFKNQALIAQGSHYIFNNSTFIIAGWRVYWA